MDRFTQSGLPGTAQKKQKLEKCKALTTQLEALYLSIAHLDLKN